jgi:hypothetical protein
MVRTYYYALRVTILPKNERVQSCCLYAADVHSEITSQETAQCHSPNYLVVKAQKAGLAL